MLSFKVINNMNEITLNNKWLPATKFNSKDRLVNYKGCQYRVVEKMEREFSSLERFSRGFLGTLAVICTLCLALFSKSVRNLFVKSKKNIRFAVLAQNNRLASQENLTLQQLIIPSKISPTTPLEFMAQKQETQETFHSVESQNLISKENSTLHHLVISPQKSPKILSEIIYQEQGIQKVLPFDEKDREEIKDTIQKFKDKALERVVKTEQQESSVQFILTQAQQEVLLEAEAEKYSTAPQQGFKIVRGGGNCVIFLDCVSGFVFKPMVDRVMAQNYIDIVRQARQVVVDRGLYLIHIPQSEFIEINNKFFVMQERVDLIFGKYNEIKGIYSYCWENEEMQDYIKTVFSQILEFISQTKFSDVKYDNIPFASDGRVALIDLDKDSAIGGLTKGGAKKNDGLFNYIPYEYFDEFLDIAKAKLQDNIYELLIQKTISIKSKAQKRVKKKEDYAQFCQKNAIFCPSQLINLDHLKIFDDKNKQAFAIFIIKSLNEELSIAKNCSVQIGRTITLSINVSDPLYTSAKKIWGGQIAYLSFTPIVMAFKPLLLEILEGLKNAGYIYKYKTRSDYNILKIIC